MNWLINIYIIKVQMLVKRILSNLENTNLFNFPLKEKNPEQSPKGYSEHWIEKEQTTHWAKVKEKPNDLQNTTQKTKARATLTSQSNLRCSGSDTYLSWEYPAWSLNNTNKGTSRRERTTVSTPLVSFLLTILITGLTVPCILNIATAVICHQ